MLAFLACITAVVGIVLALVDSTVSGAHLWAILFLAVALLALHEAIGDGITLPTFSRKPQA